MSRTDEASLQPRDGGGATRTAARAGPGERAVTAFSGARDRRTASRETERLGVLAHEMRNLLSTALLAYQALKSGGMGVDGSTGAVLGRSLRGLRDVIDRSLAEVRLAATLRSPERVGLAQFIEDVQVAATWTRRRRGWR